MIARLLRLTTVFLSTACASLAAPALALEAPAAVTDKTSIPETPAGAGLSAGPNGELRLHGKPWRGLGVNYYDAFTRLLADGKTGDLEAGFRVLAGHRIPFVRFAACGYWPKDWELHGANREEYFRRLLAVVKIAEAQGIGLIPSLFWHQPTLSDLAGEPLQEWGNPGSKTMALMREYTREVVTRLRASPAVWAWEFGNEFNLPADLPNAAEHRPPVVPALGTAPSRSARDELRHADFRIALTEFANEVRRHDPARLILSGNAFPRPSAWHQMHAQSWEKDSPEEWAAMLSGDNPGKLGGFSGRLYSASDMELLSAAAAQSRRESKPLFVGEFGVPGPLTEASRRLFVSQLEALEREKVPMAALWVYDFQGQEADWSVTSGNARAELLRLTAEQNARWQSQPPPAPESRSTGQEAPPASGQGR